MKHTENGYLFTELVLEVFKLSGRLAAEGDRMTEVLGLSSARWKVLGALTRSDQPLTVSQIARVMGQTRQAVQRLVDVMQQDGLLEFLPNPQHKRAKLVKLNDRGQQVFQQLEQQQIPWANEQGKALLVSDLTTTLATLRKISHQY